MEVLHRGGDSEQARKLQAATNRRLKSRGLAGYAVEEDGHVGAKTMLAVRKAAWSLGAMQTTLDKMTKSGAIPVGVQSMIMNPGRRNDGQRERGKKRVADMRKRRKAQHADGLAAGSASGSSDRRAVCAAAEKAAANYRKNPGAYHYLAGGIANTVIMAPTPRSYRSDCSQFAVNCYRHAGVKCPGTGTYLYSNTDSISRGGKIVRVPQPGDLGLYGSARGRTHHVEVYVGGGRFIGHGSPPIDSMTPGQPDFYLSFID